MGFQAPTLHTWYRDLEQDQLFETVAIDEARGTVEIQYLDGTVDNFDLDSWGQLSLARAEPPEDYSQAYELAPEDIWYDDQPLPPALFIDPLATIEPGSMLDHDDF